ncbi:hypothetical protein FRX31_006086, partial [Thalictrum thalictroides]
FKIPSLSIFPLFHNQSSTNAQSSTTIKLPQQTVPIISDSKPLLTRTWTYFAEFRIYSGTVDWWHCSGRCSWYWCKFASHG